MKNISQTLRNEIKTYWLIFLVLRLVAWCFREWYILVCVSLYMYFNEPSWAFDWKIGANTWENGPSKGDIAHRATRHVYKFEPYFGLHDARFWRRDVGLLRWPPRSSAFSLAGFTNRGSTVCICRFEHFILAFENCAIVICNVLCIFLRKIAGLTAKCMLEAVVCRKRACSLDPWG